MQGIDADPPPCRPCTSERTVKNGHSHNGKQVQRLRQAVCRRPAEHHQPGDKRTHRELLLERLPLAGIARMAEVFEPIGNVLCSIPTSGTRTPRCSRTNAVRLQARAAAERTTSNVATVPSGSGQARKAGTSHPCGGPPCPRQRLARLVRSTLTVLQKA